MVRAARLSAVFTLPEIAAAARVVSVGFCERSPARGVEVAAIRWRLPSRIHTISAQRTSCPQRGGGHRRLLCPAAANRTNARDLFAGHPAARRRATIVAASYPDEHVRADVAAAAAAAPLVLGALVGDWWSNTTKALAANPSLPGWAAAALIGRFSDIRVVLGSNESNPAVVAETLARDPDAEVRAAVAANPATSDRLRERLGNDKDIDVRAAAARRPPTRSC